MMCGVGNLISILICRVEMLIATVFLRRPFPFLPSGVLGGFARRMALAVPHWFSAGSELLAIRIYCLT